MTSASKYGVQEKKEEEKEKENEIETEMLNQFRVAK